MEHVADTAVFVLIVLIIVSWLFVRFRRWLYKPMLRRMPTAWEKPDKKMASMLREHGYEVVGAKLRQKVHIHVDQTSYQSRYYIDYLARDEDGLYAVKVAKAKMPMEWTGSHIRDKLLPYIMLYEELNGLIYVDTEQKSIKKITFELE